MKEYNYNKTSLSSFFIEKVKDGIIVVSSGYENPFKYIYSISEILNKYCTENQGLNVYFDLLSYRGNENRFIKTKFSNSMLDMIYSQNISKEDLPIGIARVLRKFHSQNLDYILNNSALSDYEKSLIDVA